MTSPIHFRDKRVQMNNRHFANLLDCALEIAPRFASTTAEKAELQRMIDLRDGGHFWPGRGMLLEEDFETVEQLKSWTRVFFETSQSLFLREVGEQGNTAWQAQMIYFAESTARLFLDAVCAQEDGRWFPQTRVQDEFNALVKREASQ